MIQLSQNELILDEAFLKFLRSDDLKREYRDETDKIKKKIKDDYEEHDVYVGLYKQRDGEIKTDKKHRNIVNASIYPFAHKGKLTDLGYYFIRTEPLLEQNVSDVDFVIESATKQIALFGEAKSSTRNSSGLIAQMEKRKKSIEDNRQHLHETLIPNSAKYEYVLSTEAIESRDLYAAIMRNDDKNVIWEYGGDEESLLSVFALPEDISQNKDKVLHMDDELNRNLIRVKTSTQFKNFFPKSHPVALLSILTWIDRDINEDETGYKQSFSFEDVLKICQNELENFSDDYVEKMTRRILRIGENIGFIRQLDAGNYKISTNNNDPKAREQDLKDKWIYYSIKKEKETKNDELKLKLQNRMREKHNRMFPRIDSY